MAKEVKTSHSNRDVYLSDSVRAVLAAYKQHQEKNELGVVISSINGNYIEPRNLLRKFKALTKKAIVPYIPFHNQTHATMLMRMGENPKVVSERLGHARVGITLDIYSLPMKKCRRIRPIDLMINSGHNGQKGS